VEETELDCVIEVIFSNLDTHAKANVIWSWRRSPKKEEVAETSVVLSLDYSFAFKLPSISTELIQKFSSLVYIAKW